MDYVNGSNNAVSSPSLPFSNHTFSYSCTPTSSGPTASINTATQRLQVDNPTSTTSVSLSMGLTSQSDTWTATVGGTTYRMDANNPGITINHTQSGTASSESDFSTNYDAAKASDGDLNTFWISGVTEPPTWWQLNFGAGIQRRITSYRLYRGQNDADPSEWSLFGSNTGQFTGEEVFLGNQDEFTPPSLDWYTYLVYTPGNYQYYRFAINAWQESGNNTHMTEVELLEEVTPTGCQADGADTDTVTGNMLADPTGMTGATVSGCANSPTYTPNASTTVLSESITSAALVTVGNVQSCKLNVSGGTLRQSIPASQTPGTYTIGLTFTAV